MPGGARGWESAHRSPTVWTLSTEWRDGETENSRRNSLIQWPHQQPSEAPNSVCSFSLNREFYHIFVLNSLSVGDDTALPYSCLENSKDRGARWATVHRVTKSQTQMNMAHPYILFQFKSDSDPTACKQNPWCMPVASYFPQVLNTQTEPGCLCRLIKKGESNNLLSTI